MNGDPDAGRPVRTRPRRRVLCSAAAVVLWAAPTGAVERLPADVVPLHYQLTLTPELGLNSFEGNLTVDVEVRSPTSTITLNAVDLEIYDATIALPYGRTVRPAVSSDRRQETLTLTVPTRLPAGMMKLHIEFGGRLALDLHGFSQHRANGRKYAFTRFGPTDARRAFPCFDEPGFTASFAISAIVDDRDTAVSNGKLISDTPGPRSFKHTLRFGTTRKMSPHQAALAVGDFGCLEGSAEATPIRVCAMPDRKALGRFALDAAENGLRFYDRYFALRYPFGKLDLVALPGFAADASGSPGAAFFPEEDLLLDDSSAPTDVQTRVALSVSHALARQWFGGVVSTAWWDEVWLQDGLATWIQSKPFVAWKPQWHPELMDVQMSGRVMDVDALRAARAVRAAVTTPDDIGDALDAQAIAKTASVLRMIEAYVGAETFRSGVNAYVRAHAYGRSAASEFWTEIAQASARAVDGLVSAYVDQPGVPLVSIDGRCEGPDRTIATLVQRRFSSDAPGSARPGSYWPIPVELRGLAERPGSGDVAPTVLSGATQTITVRGCVSPLHINPDASGYYRVAYEPDALERLAAVARARLTPSERVRLVGDEWALVRAGLHDVGGYLALIRTFATDPVPEVIAEALRGLKDLHDHALVDGTRTGFESWVRSVFGPVLATLGWAASPDDGLDRRRVRANILGIVGGVGRDPDVLAKTNSLVAGWLGGAAPIDVELIETVVGLAMLTADADLVGRLQAGASARPPHDRVAILAALARGSDPEALGRLLALALSEDVRGRDAALVIGAALESPVGHAPAWSFVKARWRDVERKTGPARARSILLGAAQSFCDADSREDVRRFFTDQAPDAGRAMMPLALDMIDACRDLRLRVAPRIADGIRR